jgi:hypothetical protein
MTTNSEFERAENEGMPLQLEVEGMPVQLEIPGHHYENMAVSSENIEPSNHTEMMEMLGGLFVQICRMYDVLMYALPEKDRLFIEGYHSKGKLLGDPPSLTEDAWE